MEYVAGGDMADLVDTWNARNRRRRPPPGTLLTGTQCVPSATHWPLRLPALLQWLIAPFACCPQQVCDGSGYSLGCQEHRHTCALSCQMQAVFFYVATQKCMQRVLHSPTPCRCLPEAHARRLFQQLMVAVDFLHHLGIANRDIKVLPWKPSCRSLLHAAFACRMMQNIQLPR